MVAEVSHPLKHENKHHMHRLHSNVEYDALNPGPSKAGDVNPCHPSGLVHVSNTTVYMRREMCVTIRYSGGLRFRSSFPTCSSNSLQFSSRQRTVRHHEVTRGHQGEDRPCRADASSGRTVEPSSEHPADLNCSCNMASKYPSSLFLKAWQHMFVTDIFNAWSMMSICSNHSLAPCRRPHGRRTRSSTRGCLGVVGLDPAMFSPGCVP